MCLWKKIRVCIWITFLPLSLNLESLVVSCETHSQFSHFPQHSVQFAVSVPGKFREHLTSDPVSFDYDLGLFKIKIKKLCVLLKCLGMRAGGEDYFSRCLLLTLGLCCFPQWGKIDPLSGAGRDHSVQLSCVMLQARRSEVTQ